METLKRLTNENQLKWLSLRQVQGKSFFIHHRHHHHHHRPLHHHRHHLHLKTIKFTEFKGQCNTFLVYYIYIYILHIYYIFASVKA